TPRRPRRRRSPQSALHHLPFAIARTWSYWAQSLRTTPRTRLDSTSRPCGGVTGPQILIRLKSGSGHGLVYGHVLGRSALPLNPVELLHRSEDKRCATSKPEAKCSG